MDSVDGQLKDIEENSKKQHEEIIERLNQLEDLLLLVQAENIKIKQQIGFGSVTLETLPEELQNVPKELDEIRSKLTNQVFTKEDIESIINEKLSGISTEPSDHTEETGSKPKIEIPSNVLSEISKLKEKISSLESKPVDDETLKAEINSFKEELTAAFKDELMKDKKWIENLDEKINNIKSEFKSRLDTTEDVIYNSEKILTKKGLDLYIEKISELRSSMEDTIKQFEDMRNDIEVSLNKKKDVLSKVSKAEIDVEKADTLLSKVQLMNDSVQNKLDKIESINASLTDKIESTLERITNIRDSVDSRTQTTINENIGRMQDIKRSTEDKLQLMEEKIKQEIEKSEYVRTGIDNRVKDLTEGVKHVDDLYNKINMRVDSMLDETNKRFDDKLIEISKYKNDIQDSMDSLKSELLKVEKFRDEIDDKISAKLKDSIKEVENKVSSLENKIITNVMDKTNEKVGTVHDDLIKFMDETNNKIRSIENMRDVELIEKKFDSFDSKISLQLSSRDDEIKKLHNEVDKSKKNIEKIIRNITVSELKKFSEEIDKTLPSFVTKDEFDKKFEMLNKKIDSVEKPNLEFIEGKMSNFDAKINEIKDLINNVYNRVPIVVE